MSAKKKGEASIIQGLLNEVGLVQVVETPDWQKSWPLSTHLPRRGKKLKNTICVLGRRLVGLQ